MTTCVIPQKKYVASFDVDSQNAFTPLCPNELPVPEGQAIVSELNAQADYAEYRIGSKDAHPPNPLWLANDKHPPYTPLKAENYDIAWPSHAVVGTQGFELIAGLPPVSQYDFFVWKGIEVDMHPYGNCYHDLAETISTGVIEVLRSFRVRCVIVGGLALEYCVKKTAVQLARAGFRVIINLAATRALQREHIAKAVEEMKMEGIQFISNASILENEK